MGARWVVFCLLLVACRPPTPEATPDAAKPFKVQIRVLPPDDKQLDSDLTMLLSGKSHHSHMGTKLSRELFERVKRWPDRYQKALPAVYRRMLSQGQPAGSHVDFCIQVIAKGDPEKTKAMEAAVKNTSPR